VSALGDIKVLEAGLQVDSLVQHRSSVFIQQSLDLFTVLPAAKVFPAGEERVVLDDRSHAYLRLFVDPRNSERLIDASNEGFIVEELFGIVGLVLGCECLEFNVCQGKAHRGEDRFELSLSNASLSKLVEINEEFLNADAFHHDSCTDTVLGICWVTHDVDPGLGEAVMEHINGCCVFREEWADLLISGAKDRGTLLNGTLGDVGWEDVLWPVDIFAEVVVVDLLGGTLVAVLSNHQVEDLVGRRHDAQGLHHAQELS